MTNVALYIINLDKVEIKTLEKSINEYSLAQVSVQLYTPPFGAGYYMQYINFLDIISTPIFILFLSFFIYFRLEMADSFYYWLVLLGSMLVDMFSDSGGVHATQLRWLLYLCCTTTT
jgi:hypothetical protein